MDRQLFSLFLCSVFLFEAFSRSTDAFPDLDDCVKQTIYDDDGDDAYDYDYDDDPLPARTYLREPEAVLVAELDGTIYLVDVGTAKLIWSFSSGPQIYTSYQAHLPGIDGYYVDCGDDWGLYVHNDIGEIKLRMSYEAFLRAMPHVKDEGIVLGSKKTTGFLVDAKTGKIMNAHGTTDSPWAMQNIFKECPFNDTATEHNASGSGQKTDEFRLYITRTDYIFTSYLPNSGTVLWNMSVAEIGATFLSQEVDKSPVDNPSIMEYVTGLPYKMSLPFKLEARVYRLRSQRATMHAERSTQDSSRRYHVSHIRIT